MIPHLWNRQYIPTKFFYYLTIRNHANKVCPDLPFYGHVMNLTCHRNADLANLNIGRPCPPSTAHTQLKRMQTLQPQKITHFVYIGMLVC